MRKPKRHIGRCFSGQQLSRVFSGDYCKGMTFEHWSDRDVVDDEHQCRVWQQVGFARMETAQRQRALALEKPWTWEVTIMCRMPNGEIPQVVVELKTPIRLQEIDDALNVYRIELLEGNPDYVADGWRAVIK